MEYNCISKTVFVEQEDPAFYLSVSSILFLLTTHRHFVQTVCRLVLVAGLEEEGSCGSRLVIVEPIAQG
jgi:hypothetical protein